jgi:hypothetical protein
VRGAYQNQRVQEPILSRGTTSKAGVVMKFVRSGHILNKSIKQSIDQSISKLNKILLLFNPESERKKSGFRSKDFKEWRTDWFLLRRSNFDAIQVLLLLLEKEGINFLTEDFD